MLRELPETELSDNSDYERWYFEEQRSAWEAEVREAHKVRVGGELNEHSDSLLLAIGRLQTIGRGGDGDFRSVEEIPSRRDV